MNQLLTCMLLQNRMISFFRKPQRQDVHAVIFHSVNANGDQGCQAKKKNVMW